MKIDLKELFPQSQSKDERTVNALLGSLKSVFNNEFDYINFKQAVNSLKAMNMDESTQYKSAYITASTMGITKDNLIYSAEKYITALEKERESFAEALKNQLDKKVGGKKDELKKIKDRILQNELKIEELKRENQVLQEAIDNADDNVATAKEKIEKTKLSFLDAFNSIHDVIILDIKSIKEHL